MNILFVFSIIFATQKQTGMATTYLATAATAAGPSVVAPSAPPPNPVQGTTKVSDQDIESALQSFFHMEVSPTINKSINYIVGTIDKGMQDLSLQIAQLIKLMQSEKSNSAPTGPSSNSETGKIPNTVPNSVSNSGSCQSAHPFPGVIDDYTVLIPIAMGTSRCGGCCTCQKSQMCLFNLFVQLQIITEKNKNWSPPNIFEAINVVNPYLRNSKSNSVVILEMLLSDLGKKRCKNCYLCQQIDKNLKVAFMFNTDVLGSLFEGGDKKNKEVMMTYLMGSQGIEQQMGILPFLLKLMGNETNSANSSGKCPFTGQTAGKCPVNSNNCPISGKPAPACPEAGQPNACPETVRPGVCPFTSPKVPTTPASNPIKPEPQQPSYGIPPTHPASQPEQQPTYGIAPPVNQKPAYGLSYGNYN